MIEIKNWCIYLQYIHAIYIYFYVYWYLPFSFIYIYIHTHIYIYTYFLHIYEYFSVFLCVVFPFWNMLSPYACPPHLSRLGAYGLEFGRSAVRGDGPKSQDCGAGDHQRHAQRTFGWAVSPWGSDERSDLGDLFPYELGSSESSKSQGSIWMGWDGWEVLGLESVGVGEDMDKRRPFLEEF